ncbi:hypothetical protein F4821DRAFT_248741 [Hypoxylon rubiginosum]|uniref:Uncharacterized protein n=1 Tax=Hypoxylon rubiginosum TaxID=110542 RepID=A0ACC0CMH5_9PEZI|nr:hypothetical protein F4821DRAFT_248741 [Hypoxylon rubiginosum]
MDDSSLEKHLPIVVQPMPHQCDVRQVGEDWAGVASTEQRRKLQNRLNQRARRRRQRLSKEASSSAPERRPATEPTLRIECNKSPAEQGQSEIDQVAQRLDLIRQLADQAYTAYLGHSPRPEHLLRVVQINVFHALARNAVALGFSTSWLLCDSISRFGQIGPPPPPTLPPSYPHSLVPTPLQVTEPHHPWIDLLPWPILRDRILHLSVIDSIEEVNICHDIVEFDATQSPSEKPGLIIWGSPWDPRGWEASPAFLRKWGWIVDGCEEILEGTNYWREKRGEKKLLFPIRRDVREVRGDNAQRDVRDSVVASSPFTATVSYRATGARSCEI